jgi:putative oxidoreductase
MQSPIVQRATDDLATLLIRIALGTVMLLHGAQKLFPESLGGVGHEKTIEGLTQGAGVPYFVAWLVILTEFFGGLFVVVGFLTRAAAIGIGCVMVGAVLIVHLDHGFFMNWFGQKSGEGYEYHLLAIAMCAALAVKGGGRWSIDGSIWNRR